MKRKLLYIVLYIFIAIASILSMHTFWILSHTVTSDFSVYYQAAKNAIHSTSLYTGQQQFTLFAYPPVSTLFFLPFALLSYGVSQTVFLLVSFSALIGISVLIPKLVFNKFSLLLSALVFSFSYLAFPTKFTLGMGQINLIAYLFLLVSLWLFLKRLNPSRLNNCAYRVQLLTTALFFVVACICKPILGFMLLFFILQKQWKIIFYIFGSFVFFFSIAIAIDHNAAYDLVYYLQHVIPEISKPVGREVYYNQGWMGFVFREVADMKLRLLVGYLGMLGILGLLLISLSRHKNKLFQFSLFLVALLLIDTMSWQHHFVFLIFPFFFGAHIFFKRKDYRRLALLGLSYILVSSNFAHPELLVHTPWNFLLSNTFYGALLLFILLITIPKKYLKEVFENVVTG